MVRSTTRRRPHASASTNHERRLGRAARSPDREGDSVAPSSDVHASSLVSDRARHFRLTGAGGPHLPAEVRRHPARRRAPEASAHQPEMHGLGERRRPLPLRLAGAARPHRVIAPVDRQARLLPRRIGRSHGEQIGRVQSVEDRRSRADDGERARGGGAYAGERDAERDGEGDRDEREGRAREHGPRRTRRPEAARFREHAGRHGRPICHLLGPSVKSKASLEPRRLL